MILAPIQHEWRNPGLSDFWTCPGCLHHLGRVGRGTHTCPECHRAVICTVETDPVAVARLATPDGDAE